MTTIPATMTAIEIAAPGAPEALRPVSRPMPRPGAGEVLVAVAAAGVNRPDVLQRKGEYPPPPGASDIPGLEIAGTVIALGLGVHRYKLGDPVCALVSGGGYASHCVAPEATTLPVPKDFSMVEAAALPETFFTVWHNLFERGGLKPGESVLIHGGSSGIGTTAIQLAKAFGAPQIFATAGSRDKCHACEKLGATRAIVYNAFLRGSTAEVNFLPLMLKRGTITGSTLRARSVDQKGAIAASLRRQVWPMLDQGKIRPQIYRTFPLAEAAAAHRLMETSEHIGKIVLTV